MKRILTTLLVVLLTTSVYSQQITLDFCVGTWKYINPTTGEELTLKLEKSQMPVSKYFGGGVEDCLIGGYIHKKNGSVLVDCMQDVYKNQKPIFCPIYITNSSDNTIFHIKINDYHKKNPRGEVKLIGLPSKVYLYSTSPKQIKIELVPDGTEKFYFEDAEVFPVGTSLPLEMILTKVE